MTDDDFEQFSEGLTGVMDAFGKTVSPFTLHLWFDVLKPYGLEAVTHAFRRHVSSPDAGMFPPKPADIIRMMGGTSGDGASRAWAKVDRAVRHVGTYRSVAFDDPLVHRVLSDMGGWILMGMKSDDEWPFVAREFEARYRGYAMRQERPDYPPVLNGIIDAENGPHGYAQEKPVLIGNRQLAIAVMSGGTERPLLGISEAPRISA
jgi:hypothetical protein